jgi:hypothetical protein
MQFTLSVIVLNVVAPFEQLFLRITHLETLLNRIKPSRVFNSMYLFCYEPELPSLKLKTRPKPV